MRRGSATVLIIVRGCDDVPVSTYASFVSGIGHDGSNFYYTQRLEECPNFQQPKLQSQSTCRITHSISFASLDFNFTRDLFLWSYFDLRIEIQHFVFNHPILMIVGMLVQHWFEFREHRGAFHLTQSLQQIIAFRVAREPSDNCTF